MNSKRKKAYEEVNDRDDGLCRVCGKQASDIHHILFRSHGGKDEPSNLVCLCREHHEMAHSDEKVWREYLFKLIGEGR